ncbi:hypothetical protein [Sulfurimonas sp.]|uniref:hypothetical protein n=1 Tax=Sulfurimonas sp. TaxID=2022749 RepID=UPI003D0DD85C
MKKRFIVMLFFATTQLLALEVKPFVGIDISETKTDQSLKQVGTTITNFGNFSTMQQISETNSKDYSDTIVGIKTGITIENTHRIYVYYSDFQVNDDLYNMSVNLALLNYDYLFRDENNFTPYIGLHVGQSKLEMQNKDDNGLIVLYKIHKNFEFELSGAYSISDTKVNLDDYLIADGTYSFDGSASSELKNITRISLGFNVKF